MKKLLIVLLSFVLVSTPAKSQSLKAIEDIFYDHFMTQLSAGSEWFAYHPPGKPEAFLGMIRIDSSGKIWDIQYLANEKYKDTAYQIFQQLKPASFNNWRNMEYRNTTLLLPIYVLPAKVDFVAFKKLAGLDVFASTKTEFLQTLPELILGWIKLSH